MFGLDRSLVPAWSEQSRRLGLRYDPADYTGGRDLGICPGCHDMLPGFAQHLARGWHFGNGGRCDFGAGRRRS